MNGELLEQLQKNWVEGQAFEFPKTTIEVAPNLNAESILPDDIRSDESGKIRAKQNEWAYTLLTAKLWESYLNELDELKKKSTELTQYDRSLFDDAKSFWERVLEHRKERDISQEALDKIKDDVNAIFEKLKTFRKTESAEFESASTKFREEVVAKLDDLKSRATEKANFKALLEEFKTIQNDSRKNRYSKSDDALLRKLFDSVFQYVNAQRNLFFSDMTASRVKGLNDVIDRLASTLSRDKRDLEYMLKKGDNSKASSLEMQLTKLKVNMLNETIASKEEKLKDIRQTLEKLLKQSGKGAKKNEPVKEVAVENITADEAKSVDTTTPVAGE